VGSVLLLLFGLGVVGASAPGSYEARFRALKGGGPSPRPEDLTQILREAAHGQGRAILVSGLLLLTLVPIGRVAFSLLVFVRERDWIFSVLTALVLGLLCIGVLLGRIG
jgi:hypothetical protein